MTSKVRVWATSNHSLWDISQALRRLRVTHTVDPIARHTPRKLIRPSKTQKTMVHLSTRVDGWQTDAVNFVSASVAELANTNFLPFAVADLDDAVRHALRSPDGIVPSVQSWDAVRYVEAIARPSVLNVIQTEVYKIQPYALRKEVQALVLNFFNGRISVRDAMRKLDMSMKTEKLKPVFKTALPLREAVAMMKHMEPEKVEEATGFSAFELLYLTKAKAR